MLLVSLGLSNSASKLVSEGLAESWRFVAIIYNYTFECPSRAVLQPTQVLVHPFDVIAEGRILLHQLLPHLGPLTALSVEYIADLSRRSTC
jgi:hypothetical protein